MQVDMEYFIKLVTRVEELEARVAALENSRRRGTVGDLSSDKNERAKAVLEYLNERAKTRYRPCESNLRFIRARLENYSEDELKAVIDKKVKEWSGTAMAKYIRPETLFNATKFEGYVASIDLDKKPERAPTTHDHGVYRI